MKLLLILPLLLSACATTGGIVDLGNAIVGSPENVDSVLKEACEVSPFHWGFLEGLGVLDFIALKTSSAADRFSEICDRFLKGETLTPYEKGVALGLQQRVLYDLGKAGAVKVLGMFGAQGMIPWLP